MTGRQERLPQCAVEGELAELPEHYRAALVMHVYDDRPLRDLADHFGTTIGSVRGRLQRGKQRDRPKAHLSGRAKYQL